MVSHEAIYKVIEGKEFEVLSKKVMDRVQQNMLLGRSSLKKRNESKDFVQTLNMINNIDKCYTC